MSDRADAEDAAQDALARFWRAIAVTRTADIDNDQRLEIYLFVIVRNECYKRTYANRRYQSLPPQATPQVHSVRADDANVLREQLLAELPADEQEIIELVEAGFSHSEIASRLGSTEGAIAVRLHRVRKLLRARFPDLAGN